MPHRNFSFSFPRGRKSDAAFFACVAPIDQDLAGVEVHVIDLNVHELAGRGAVDAAHENPQQRRAGNVRTPGDVQSQLIFLLSCGYFKAAKRFYPAQRITRLVKSHLKPHRNTGWIPSHRSLTNLSAS